MGPPPLWSVAGEGGLGSGLGEGSGDGGGRGSVPRLGPEGEKGEKWGQGCPRQSALVSHPGPLSPRLGDGGASSFGLRLRTGERCSRRGRSEGPQEGSLAGRAHPFSPPLPHMFLRRYSQDKPTQLLSPASQLPGAHALLVRPSRSRGTQHLPSPVFHPARRHLPHQQGPGAGPHAQTLLAALATEAAVSAGHLGEATGSECVLSRPPTLPWALAFPPSFRVPSKASCSA